MYVLINVVVEQTLGERKRKQAADKKKFEEELEELRSQQEVSGSRWFLKMFIVFLNLGDL